MESLIQAVILITVPFVVGLLALAFGADSRDSFGDDHGRRAA